MKYQLPQPYDQLPENAVRQHQLSSDECLFRQDNRTRGLFYLQCGSVELLRMTKNGDKVLIHKPLAGETFAEASLFSPAYHCDAIAIDTSKVLEIDRALILNKFVNDPEFAAAIARNFAGQIQTYRRRLEIIAIHSAEQRVFTALSNGMLKSNIKNFANEIGLTHEAVYRALARLVRQSKIVKTGRGKYRV